VKHGQIDVEEQKALDEPLSWGRLRYVQILNARAQLLAKLGEVILIKKFLIEENKWVWDNKYLKFRGKFMVYFLDFKIPIGRGERYPSPRVGCQRNSRRVIGSDPACERSDVLHCTFVARMEIFRYRLTIIQSFLTLPLLFLKFERPIPVLLAVICR